MPSLIEFLVFIGFLVASYLVYMHFFSDKTSPPTDDSAKLLVTDKGIDTNTIIKADPAQYVTMLRLSKSTGYINLAEVLVYDNSGNNIALGSTVTAMSNYEFAPPANNLNIFLLTKPKPSRFGPSFNVLTDGSLSTTWDNGLGSVMHTGSDGPSWVNIVFPQPVEFKNIRDIKILNRTDCCQDRAVGLKVELFDSVGVISKFSWTLDGVANSYHYDVNIIK